MKVRSIAVSAALCLVTAALAWAAADGFMGTWKLNEAKSKVAAGMPKNNTVVYEASGDNIKVTIDGVDASGKPTHNDWTGKFDGKDYPVTGDATSDSRAYKSVDDHTIAFTVKKGGKTTITGRMVLSADGKTRTVSTTSTDSSGKKVTGTAVFDKQ